MKKLIKQEVVDYYLDWKYDIIPLSKIREDLDELEKLGVTGIEFDADTDSFGSIIFNIKPMKEREETNEEVQERMEFIQKREEAIKKQELQQLEILKKKYNQ